MKQLMVQGDMHLLDFARGDRVRIALAGGRGRVQEVVLNAPGKKIFRMPDPSRYQREGSAFVFEVLRRDGMYYYVGEGRGVQDETEGTEAGEDEKNEAEQAEAEQVEEAGASLQEPLEATEISVALSYLPTSCTMSVIREGQVVQVRSIRFEAEQQPQSCRINLPLLKRL